MEKGKSEKEILKELGNILDGKEGKKAKSDPFIMQLTQSLKKKEPEPDDEDQIEILDVIDEKEQTPPKKEEVKKESVVTPPEMKEISEETFESLPELKIEMDSEKEMAQQDEKQTIQFEGDRSTPIINYDVPSPSAYEGRNYIEIPYIPGVNLKPVEPLDDEEELKKFLKDNREQIYEYLKYATKEDFERDYYIVFDLDSAQPDPIKVQYPATLSFDDPELTEWKLVGKEGASFNVIPEYNGHKNVLKITDKGTTSGEAYPRAEFIFKDGPKLNGTIEFWFAISDYSKNYYYFFLGDNASAGTTSSTGWCTIDIANKGNKLQFYDGTKKTWIVLDKALTNGKWHHCRIDFAYYNQAVSIYIDYALVLRSAMLHDPPTRKGFEKLAFAVQGASPVGTMFIDSIGFSWDDDYKVGDNLKAEEELDAISAMKQQFLSNIRNIDEDVLALINEIKIETDEEGNVIDYGLKAKYQLFRYFIQVAFSSQMRPIFYNTLGGLLKLKYMKLPNPRPRLMFIETYKLTSFPGDYGADRIVKTFSLLPGEKTNISVKTWKKSVTNSKEASSVLDSYTEEKADEFENSIHDESSQSSKIDKADSYSTESSKSSTWGVEASVGYGPVSVGASYESSESKSKARSKSTNTSRENFSKNVLNATEKHSQKSSAKRDVNIETSYEKTEEQGEERAIVRTIENINLSRTLNFTFRQMTQEHHTLLHLIDLRLAYFNGYPGSMKEFELHQISDIINKYIDYVEDDQQQSAQTKSSGDLPDVPEYVSFDEVVSRLQNRIIDEYSNVLDYTKSPKNLVEIVNDPNKEFSYLRIIPPIGDKGKQSYTIRDPIKDENEIIVVPADERTVNGIIINTRVITMKTDGVIVEALLGKANALDDYTLESRRESIRSDALINDQLELEKIKNNLAASIIKNLLDNGKYELAADFYKEMYGVQSGLKLIKQYLGVDYQLQQIKKT